MTDSHNLARVYHALYAKAGRYVDYISAAFAVLIILATGPSYAQGRWIDETYPDFSKYLQAELDEVASSHKLSADQQRTAEKVAGHWVHIGVCEGDGRLVDSADSSSVIQWVMLPRLERDLDRAFLSMIALITRKNLGRKAEFPCRFALEKARLPNLSR
jgi:hypothetical protein